LAATQKKAIIILGPTAVGKTAIAIAVAEALHTEIVSADSRQCYQGMPIGTAQPSAEERAMVEHHFIAEYPVTTHLTAADYETIALDHLANIFYAHNTAVVCGGTGLYINALCNGLDEMPEVDRDVEAAINEQYRAEGLAWLQAAVSREDPEFYAAGEQQNPARLLRALIFKRSTGESITAYRSGNKKQRDFTIIKIGLELPRDLLYACINQRVEQMMNNGLLEEVKALLPYRHLKNLQTVGYSELFEHLDGKMSLQQAVDKIKQHTRNYAKRQMTWFRKDAEIKWFNAGERNVAAKIIDFINN